MIGLIIGAAVSILGSAVSSIASAESARKAADQQRARRDEAERRYLHEVNKDFLDTETAKSTLSAIRKQNDKQIEALGNNAIKAGASDEAKIAAASRANETYADAASRIAGYGTQYKQNIEDRYLARLDQFDDKLVDLERQKADAWIGLGNSVASVGSSVAQAHGEGVFTKAKTAESSTTTTAQNSPENTTQKPAKTGSTINSGATSDPYNFIDIGKRVRQDFGRDTIEPKKDKSPFPQYGITSRSKISGDLMPETYDYNDMSMKNILWPR